MPDETTRIRETLLDLIPGLGIPFLLLPEPQEVAAKAGADLDTVTAIMTPQDALLEFLLTPLMADASHAINAISISRTPSMNEQRSILRRGIEVATQHPREVRLLVLLLDRMAPATANRLADTILYSTGLRLLGIDHEDDPDYRRRATFAWELISIAVISHRHSLNEDSASEDIVEALITACMCILHPPASGTLGDVLSKPDDGDDTLYGKPETPPALH